MPVPISRAIRLLAIGCAVSLAMPTALSAQIRSVDPNDAIDADIDAPPPPPPAPAPPASTDAVVVTDPGAQAAPTTDGALPDLETDRSATATGAVPAATYKRDDLIGAAEGVFGKGAEGLGRMIEKILAEQGEPNGYIVGREAGGAFMFGLRYGSGTLHHRIEGARPAYWTGPSIGFDAGANAAQTFVLVYNLYDTNDLYRRYPAGEGAAYFVGGFNASYLRRGDVVLIPVRLGVGARLGANVGYMKFRPNQDWNPF